MIYSVEDDARIREMVLYALKQSGLPARGFADAASFWAATRDSKPSLVLLDIMLPGEDGLSILARLRNHADTQEIPVLMLTAKGDEMDKVVGLNAGADDYLAKPFSVLELVARVNALLRRTQKTDQASLLELGDIRLDAGARGVSVGGKSVALTLKEFELLAYLLRHPGRACSREQLLSAIWDELYTGNTRTVDVHIKTLRQKLGAAGQYIDTVRGVGYRLQEVVDEKETD